MCVYYFKLHLTIIIKEVLIVSPQIEFDYIIYLFSSISLRDIPFLFNSTKGTSVMEFIPIYFGCSQLYNLCGFPLHVLHGWHSRMT